jgi:hypothetical protein
MKPKDYKNILGVAWEASTHENFSYVNTAIGLNSNDLSDHVQQQSDRIEALEEQAAKTNAILAELLPGFAEAANIEPVDHDHKEDITERQEEVVYPSNEEYEIVETTADQIVYFPVERDLLEEGFRLAEQIAIEVYAKSDKDIKDHPFWNRIYSEPGFKEEVLGDMAEELKNTMHSHKDLNERIIGKN